VVALLFIIFDVEVAFFFPWAAVFGKSTNLMRDDVPLVKRAEDGTLELTKTARHVYQEMGIREPVVPQTVPPTLADQVFSLDDLVRSEQIIREGARQLAWVTLVDIAAFFAVLLVGFAYVWRRGDLDWVRAVTQGQPARELRPVSDDPLEQEAVLSA
jgi:NADH-quinone oxidoreductase subunit A